jgi:phosphoglycerate dehydrogenase-like enzyme
MAKPLVHVFWRADQSGESYKQLEAAGCEVKLADDKWITETTGHFDILPTMDGENALLGVGTNRVPITADVLKKSPDLRIVAVYTIGTDNIDMDVATDLGIMVTHGPTEANWGGVAEGVMAMMLAKLKKTRERDRHMKEGGWRDPKLMGTFLGRRQDGYEGITIGIIGFGRIGTRLADLLAPWRVRVIACDPYVDDYRFIHHNVERVDMDTLLAESDVVTIHTNLTSETRGLMGAEQFAKMKKTATFINAARGPCMNEDALYHALESGQIDGAILDVFEEEPTPKQSPLLGMGDKVLLSPHVISLNRASGLEPAIPWATEAVLTALRGDVPEHVFNPEVLDKWRSRFGGKNLLA